MGQFKPMVKMMTTEPTVELKLKKGGSVEKKMQMGGTPSVDAPRMPTRGGSASGEAMPGAAPMKPSMAARRRAMKARPGGAAPAAPVGRAAAVMKKGGGVKKMAMGGNAFNMLRNQVSSPGSFNNPSNIGFGTGPRLPTNLPPRDSGTGAGPRLTTNLPPRDSGTGAGPRLPTNLPPRGGTPAMVKNAPGYRGSGTQPMPIVPRGMMKKGGKVHEDVAQDRAMIKKAMSGKKFATGGVVMGQGGYATGGIIKSEMGKSKITTAHPNNSPAKTGEVKMGNGGGYKHGGGVKMYAKGGGVNGNVSTTPPGVSGTTTGSVKKSNGGGYKTGGAAKKFADGGAVQSDGRAVKMPQGNKRPSAPVSISRLSGTFKKGGSVGKYSTGGSAEARSLQEAQEQKRERKEREAYANAPKVASELEEAMNPMSMMKEMAGKVKKLFAGSETPKGSVTKTEKSVTVAPGKKRGGAC
jgi:hypothetical protein